MADRFAIDAIFRAIDQISSPVGRMAAGVRKSASRMERSFAGVNGAIGKVRAGVGKVTRVAAVGAGALAVGLAKVVSTGADVEQTLVSAGSKFSSGVIKRGTKEFKELADAAGAVAGATEFGVNEAAGALKFMAKAGESAQVSMGSLRLFADLATVAEVDLARAADIASDSVGPLGFATDVLADKTAAYTKTADKMSKTANIANLGIEELFESVKAGAQGFIESGQSADQFLAIISVLAQNSNKGSKAGKDLARVMGRITDKSTKAQKSLRGLNIAFTEGVGESKKFRVFTDIMGDLNKKFATISEPRRLQAIADIFGKNSREAGLTILRTLDKVAAAQAKIAKADKSTETLAVIERNTTLGRIKTFWSTVESIVVDTFFIIQKDVEKVVEKMTDWARVNKTVFSDKIIGAMNFFRDNIGAIVDLGPGVAKFVLALWGLSQVLSAIQATLAIVAAVTTVTAGTVAVVAIVVLLAVAALGVFIILWDEVKEVMQDYADYVTGTFNGVIETLTDFWTDLTDGVKAGEPVWIAAAAALFPLAAIVTGIMLPVIGLIVGVKLLMAAWDVLPKFFSDTWDKVTASFLKADRALDRAIANMKAAINDFTGTEVFDVQATLVPGVAAPGLGAANSPPPPSSVLPFPPVAGPVRPQGGAGPPPQVIDTTTESISRSIMETIRSLKLDINLNDPRGAVESIEQKGLDDSVKVTRTGTL